MVSTPYTLAIALKREERRAERREGREGKKGGRGKRRQTGRLGITPYHTRHKTIEKLEAKAKQNLLAPRHHKYLNLRNNFA